MDQDFSELWGLLQEKREGLEFLIFKNVILPKETKELKHNIT